MKVEKICIYTSTKMSILMKNVKAKAFAAIESVVYSCNGVIFGGYVRDEYIREYHSEKFKNESKYCMDKLKLDGIEEELFWNEKISPETRGRMIIAEDMDISFQTVQESETFLKKLKDMVEFTYVVANEKKKYYSTVIKSVKNVKICIKVGMIPFICEGEDLIIELDIVVGKTIAPFGNIDMLCNGFIKTAEGKRYSRNTGTSIDKLSDYEHHMRVGKIMEEMVNFRTELSFARTGRNKQEINRTALRRIKKMDEKGQGWEYTNMPIRVEKSEGGETCCICYEEIGVGERMSYTVSKKEGREIGGVKMHYGCCMRYLEHQSERIVYRCPCRGEIDFSVIEV